LPLPKEKSLELMGKPSMRRPRLTKHISYYELIDALRNADRCPLCDIEENSVKRYFESLLHENVNDPGVRDALATSHGYCPRHAHYLRNHGNGLGIAILYQDQIALFLQSLEGSEAIASKVARKGASFWHRSESCPACRVQNECRSHYCNTLVRWLQDEEMRSALNGSSGFCVPHFLKLLDMPMDADTRAILIEKERAHMSLLLGELREFQRKHDYRFRDEGFGSESNSWSRVIKMMVGEEGLF